MKNGSIIEWYIMYVTYKGFHIRKELYKFEEIFIVGTDVDEITDRVPVKK